MKPPEILSMLEEAAGTRMYETKKLTAVKTMEKKQVKVDEINRVLSDDILPALEKLRTEREEYMSWATANQDIERLKRFVIAFEYINCQRFVRFPSLALFERRWDEVPKGEGWRNKERSWVLGIFD